MGSLLLEVLPLALAAAVTPTLFALQVLVVSGPDWQRRAMAVVAGAASVFITVFVLVLAGLSQLPDAGTGTHSRWEYLIELAVGAVLVPLALWMLRPHPAADAAMERKVTGYAKRANAWVFVGLAAYMSVSDFSSLLVVVPALHDVTRADVALTEKALVVLLVLLLVLLPVLVPPAAVVLGGDRARAGLRRVYGVVMGHQMQVMGVVALGVGVVLVWRGVQGL